MLPPDHPAYRQALICLERDRPEDALELLTEALEAHPGNACAHLQRGKALGALGDLVGAAEDYAAAIATGDLETAYEARFRRGLVFTEQLLLAEAGQDLGYAIALRPDRMGPHHHRGWARFLAGDLQGAVEDYTEVLRKRADHVATWFLRGRARLDQEDFDGAMADFLVALVLEPDHPEASFHFQLASEVASRHERRAPEPGDDDDRPADWAAFMARAEARRAASDHVGAIADFYGALRHRIHCPQARMGVALAREALKHEASARVAAERIGQVPNDTRAFVRRADALRRLGKPEEACAVLLTARRVDPRDPDVHAELGITLACWLSDPAGALPHLDEALRLEPNHVEARRHRALVRRELGRLKEAIADFDMLEHLIPGDRTLHLNRGSAHEQAGDWEAAERDFSLGLRVVQDHEGLLWKRACARLALGRYAEARADLERAFTLRPDLARQLAGEGQAAGTPRADLERAIGAFSRLRPDAIADQAADLRALLAFVHPPLAS